MHRVAVAVAVGVTASMLLASPATANEARLRDAVQELRVAGETNAGYERSKFKHWVDADGDCQDTRAEVLVQESTVATTGGCTITTGKWFSYYDRRTWTQASDVDIDHLVPLAEAWGSGAKAWTAGTRQRFANDLADRRALVAVTDNVNQAKGAQDPSEWLPRFNKCRYVREWVAIKLRWKLKVNDAEKRKLVNLAGNCTNSVLRWKPARVVLASDGGGAGSTTASGVKFVFVVYDPPGPDDGSNLNAERVKIENVSGQTKNLTGWTLSDAAGNHYHFPTFSLPAGETVVVHSGSGSNGAHHLYAGWGYTWNNTGDTAKLRNQGGTLADRCQWGDGNGTKYC
jgi:hypothetical protein